jgi:hypothetical protein
MVPHLPGFIGSPAVERLDLRFLVDREHDRVGRRMHIETDDIFTFSARAGSVERLKVRRRCGCSRLARQMRCTVCSAKPTVLAIARPVQWVISPGGSPQVSAKTLLTVSCSRLLMTLFQFHGAPGMIVDARDRAQADQSRRLSANTRTAYTGRTCTLRHAPHVEPLSRSKASRPPLRPHSPGSSRARREAVRCQAGNSPGFAGETRLNRLQKRGFDAAKPPLSHLSLVLWHLRRRGGDILNAVLAAFWKSQQ